MDCCHRLFAAHIYVKVVLSLSEMFEGDTMRGGAQRPDLINMLRHETAPGVHGVMVQFGVDLSFVSRLGGHSQPRGKERFPQHDVPVHHEVRCQTSARISTATLSCLETPPCLQALVNA